VRFSESVLEGVIPSHAALDFNVRRPADHDGAPRPLRSAVLLLPARRQHSRKHLLRLIDKHVSFEFVRQQLKDSYSETERPSIDPELLLRILLIGYLYGITSERKLVEELRMHLAWRWFTGLGSIRRFRITRRSLRTGTDGFRNRSCSSRAVRQTQAKPLTESMRQWFEATLSMLSRKSETTVAIRYALSRWDALTRYIEDGHIEIDNNAAERSLRSVALGRKNYLFAGSDAGGNAPRRFTS
jgi:Transposase IS66 family/Transposase domain (DUF772)